MEFRWEDLEWGRSLLSGEPIVFKGRAYIDLNHGLKFEIWTHDDHKTYTVLLRKYSDVPVERIAIGVPKLEALCVAIEWFKNNT